MRQIRGSERANALWGKGSRGEARSNALWGRSGRRASVAVAAIATAFVFAGLASAGQGAGQGSGGGGPLNGLKAVVADSLISAIQQNPDQSFDVILEGPSHQHSGALAAHFVGRPGATGIAPGHVLRAFTSIDGLHVTLTGNQIVALARTPFVTAIMPNDLTVSSGSIVSLNTQTWAWSTKVPVDWVGASRNLSLPTIAVVDSGIDASRTADFSNRVVGQVNLASLQPSSTGDGFGHGTAVADVAAGAATGTTGVSPRANLLSLRIMDDQGDATVADVVAAADWILQNKSTYNIKVANFSLHGSNRASVLFDPIDQAVEKLWLNGVTVVAAAGNYAVDGANSGVQFAPGNDPFVITVGAADTMNTINPSDDVNAPFSAWGYTGDGFMKPDIAAPGRHIIAGVTPTATMSQAHPDHIVSNGYMELSGTSFSAPMISGAAAELLAQHPTWTPDQVKGALMVSADRTAAPAGSLGVGELDMSRARTINNPPNPNEPLEQFLTTDDNGLAEFNATAWQQAALASPTWDAAAWSDAAWSSAAWSSAAWSSAAWSSAAWSSAAWGSAAWSDAAWSDAAWSDAAWADNAEGDGAIDPTLVDASGSDLDSTAADLGIDPNCDPTVSDCTASTTP